MPTSQSLGVNSQNGLSPIIVLLVLTLPLAFFLGLFVSKPPLPSLIIPTQKEEVFVEKIKGSRFHSPDATWWGYNQEKIVGHKDTVFSYYIDNDDDSNKTTSRFVVVKKDGDKSWEEGAMFPTSRPGNLLIDSNGILHAFVFEPFNVEANDSLGKILHYYFPDSASGDIKNFKTELIVDNDGKSETANIRVGAAIGQDDTMVISFGLTKFNPAYKDQSEHIYFKKPTDESWQHAYVDGLQHDYFYPFTLVSTDSVYLLPIQDDYVPPTNSISYPNIYQKIMFLQYQNGTWKNEMIVDLSNHELAKSRSRLLEQEDLYEDKNGTLHILYKEFLNPENTFSATSHWHTTGKPGNWKSKQINFEKPGVNWVRLVEVDDNLYYLVTTFGEIFISPIDKVELTKLDIPEDAKNNYPYVSTIKGGSNKSNFVDLLLLGADQKLFQEGKNTNYYIRIPKSQFTKLKQVSN